jgi:RNA polymerase sigma factor (sigma-70 family)
MQKGRPGPIAYVSRSGVLLSGMAPDPKPAPLDDASAPPGTAAPAATDAPRLQHLIEEHNRALHAFLMMRVRDEHEAREIAQEAYVRMLELHKPGAVNFLRAYLFKAAANIAINRARQRQARNRLDQLDVPADPVDQLTPDRRLLAEEELQTLKTALFELSPKCRRAFVLHRFCELSQEEVARELNIQPRMVRHYLTQAGLYCKLRIRGLSPAEARDQVNR